MASPCKLMWICRDWEFRANVHPRTCKKHVCYESEEVRGMLTGDYRQCSCSDECDGPVKYVLKEQKNSKSQ